MQEFIKTHFNTYTIFARYFPALFSALPFFVLWYFLSDNVKLGGLVSFLLSIRLIGIEGLTFSLVFLHFYSLIIREISKIFQRKYFTGKNANGFPTTYLMTYADNSFSDSYKEKYRKLISDRFDFELLNNEEEEADPSDAQKRLNEATGFVRLDIKNGYLVLKHNIWFGLFRNFIGGTCVAMPLCMIGIFLGWFCVADNNVLILILVFLFFLYLFVFIFRKPILVHNGEAYAKQLFSEFMGSNTR